MMTWAGRKLPSPQERCRCALLLILRSKHSYFKVLKNINCRYFITNISVLYCKSHYLTLADMLANKF